MQEIGKKGPGGHSKLKKKYIYTILQGAVIWIMLKDKIKNAKFL